MANIQNTLASNLLSNRQVEQLNNKITAH